MMEVFNFAWSRIHPETNIRYFPTRVSSILFREDETKVMEAIDSISIPSVNEFVIKLRNHIPQFKNLVQSKIMSFVNTRTIEFDDIIKQILQRVPADGDEIVEWVQETAAMNAMMSSFMDEYNKHSEVVAGASDPTIPSFHVEDIRFISTIDVSDPIFKRVKNKLTKIWYRGKNKVVVTGDFVYSLGNALTKVPFIHRFLKAPNGKFTTIIGRDYISAAAAMAKKGHFQWDGMLIKWKHLAKTPIKGDIRFPTLAGDYSGHHWQKWRKKLYELVSPNFFSQDPGTKKEMTKNIIKISSKVPQEIKIRFRDPTNYTNIIEEVKLKIPAGQSQISYNIASYPFVPPVVTEIHPSQPAALNEFTVY